MTSELGDLIEKFVDDMNDRQRQAVIDDLRRKGQDTAVDVLQRALKMKRDAQKTQKAIDSLRDVL